MSEIIDRDVKEVLRSWGAWANDHHDGLGCKSPSDMLMKSAPFADANEKLSKSVQVAYISDEQALMVDKAVGKLARHSVLLWAVLRLHYQYDWSIRKIAKEHLTPIEYPNDKEKKVHHTVAAQLLERAVGVIEGAMLDNT